METTASEEPDTASEESWNGFSSIAEEEEVVSGDESSNSSIETSNASDEGEDDETTQERSSAFKAWALSQRNTVVGFEPSHDLSAPVGAATSAQMRSIDSSFKRVPSDNNDQRLPGIVDRTLFAAQSEPERQVHHVYVQRPEAIEASRAELPIISKEQEIMETIFNNDVAILSGATGSGKTTQVPQFLFEAGYGDPDGPTPGMIGITQPRRVAAVSMAKRVAYEMGKLHEKVSHQVRFDTTVSAKTAMKFMTDGVLLREISQDFTLSKYSAIIIDEAHERSVNTDILIGMLSRIVETRRRLFDEKRPGFKLLKVVIMSATLRLAEFKDNRELFRKQSPPVIVIEGKQYSVGVHFARRTKRDYVGEVLQKVSRGHRKLPPGGMLVFVTGQSEIEFLERRLKAEFPCADKYSPARPKMHVSAHQTQIEDDDVAFVDQQQHSTPRDDHDYLAGFSDEDGPIEEEDDFDIPDEGTSTSKRVHVLPLYSQLSAEQQARVFEAPPADSRLIVLATNVAETSITIPNIRYVFDTGRSKVKQYDPGTGVQTFAIDWISKASAQQRTGRAGRTGSGGHCYRLYSSAIFEDAFAQFAEPEILKTPVEGVVLQLKAMGIPDITRFPFPTPLVSNRLHKAERLLQYLGCLENITNKVTDLGKQLSAFPISPRLARILVLAEQQPNLLQHALSLVAMLAIPEVFLSESQLGFNQDIEPSLGTESGDKAWSYADAERARGKAALRQEFASFHGRIAGSDKYSDGVKLLTVSHVLLFDCSTLNTVDGQAQEAVG